MQNPTTTATREALIKDVDHLKRDAVKITQDVKDHAVAHVDETKKKINDTLQQFRVQVAAYPLAVLGVGLFIGFLLGTRRSR
jgi:ElaB/YqjD/DUF883 family membrane-anchored ribosome-binding protein